MSPAKGHPPHRPLRDPTEHCWPTSPMVRRACWSLISSSASQRDCSPRDAARLCDIAVLACREFTAHVAQRPFAVPLQEFMVMTENDMPAALIQLLADNGMTRDSSVFREVLFSTLMPSETPGVFRLAANAHPS